MLPLLVELCSVQEYLGVEVFHCTSTHAIPCREAVEKGRGGRKKMHTQRMVEFLACTQVPDSHGRNEKDLFQKMSVFSFDFSEV